MSLFRGTRAVIGSAGGYLNWMIVTCGYNVLARSAEVSPDWLDCLLPQCKDDRDEGRHEQGRPERHRRPPARPSRQQQREHEGQVDDRRENRAGHHGEPAEPTQVETEDRAQLDISEPESRTRYQCYQEVTGPADGRRDPG